VSRLARPGCLTATACLSAILTLGTAVGAAQTLAAQADPPAPPVVSRTEDGHPTVRAIRIETPIVVDGRLDEDIYESVDGAGGFIQQEPQPGEPTSEPTDVWIFFDDKNVYVAARCWDSQPERGILTEMRRDSLNQASNENFAVAFDTQHDKRNGFFFATTALGAIRDQAIINETAYDNWNTVFSVKAHRFERGWSLEMAIPFKSLRYRGSGPQVWGINFRRIIKWKNEYTFLSRMPPTYGMSYISFAGTLVGLETPAASTNLEVKPYVVSSLTTDRSGTVSRGSDLDAATGVDVKYGLTRSLIADATINTDFAQVEEDLQQINLTRFNLFFPEKRDFFLEGAGIFTFGGVDVGTIGTPGDVPVLFFSRRIGLSGSQSVPVQAGGRLTGKVGRFSIGALNIRTADKPEAAAVATNFSVLRFKWDFLQRSQIGVIGTYRSRTLAHMGSNGAFGADAILHPSKSTELVGYVAMTDSPGVRDGNTSYRGRFEYLADRYGLAAEHLMVGDRFDPQVGYVRRVGFQHEFLQARFSPRPKHSTRIRKFTYQGTFDYYTNADRTELQNRQWTGNFAIEFLNSNQMSAVYKADYELLPADFTISPGVVVPAGGYNYRTAQLSYSVGQQRMVSGRLTVSRGSFYGGTKTEATYSGRIAPSARFAAEPSVTLNWVDLPGGHFNVRLVNARFIVTPSALMLLSSLVQYNAISHSLSSSLRLRWEYSPGSELFVVYAEGRDTAVRGVPEVLNRSFAVKVTRLVRF
jgi:hypothetical protein